MAEIRESTDFHIKKMEIIKKDGDTVDIRNIYEELNLFDSIFSPVSSGNILLTDAIGLSEELKFDGSEAIKIEIVKFLDDDRASFKQAFRIYKQTGRQNQNQGSEKYILHFVADELLYSDQQRINQSYDMTYTEIVKKIMEKYLKIPTNELDGIFDTSMGIRKLVIPNLRPLAAIEWCAKRAVDDYQSPNYMFFQNKVGFNFARLSNLLTLDHILDINFKVKNLEKDKLISELCGARYLEIIDQRNSTERTRSGVEAGKFIGFDPLNRKIDFKNIGYYDHYDKMKHANKTPNLSEIPNRETKKNIEMFDTKKVVSTFNTSLKNSNYVKKNDPESILKADDTENYIFQRTALLQNLMSRRIKLVMPGNFQLSSGFNVKLKAPNFSEKETGTNDSNSDESINGKYIIIASRQIIKYDKHETVLEIATTSTMSDRVEQGTMKQTEEIKNYG
jgi:hypothetical protein